MRIETYSFGRIIIDGKRYTKDLIIFPEKVEDNWWRQRGHFLQVQDLKEVFHYDPDLLIVGNGANGVMDISDKVKGKCNEEDIELRIEKTGRATTLYNKLNGKKEVVAALHLTC